jgi:hypothetical protein
MVGFTLLYGCSMSVREPRSNHSAAANSAVTSRFHFGDHCAESLAGTVSPQPRP